MKFLFTCSLFAYFLFTCLSVSAQKKTVVKAPEKVYQYAEQMPEFPGGQDSLFAFLIRNTKYPPEAFQNKIQGKVFLGFVVDTFGTIKDTRVLTPIDPNLEAEALRVVKLMPKWKPGKEKGHKVSVKCTLPVKFAIKSAPAPAVDSVYSGEGVDVQPEFPGGENGMQNFLAQNVRYPTYAQREGLEGLVVLSFIVDTNGQIDGFTVLKSIHASLDNEAIRVAKAMPKWKPGIKNGQPVKVKYTMPLRFDIR